MSELRERKTANKGQAVAADASRAASLPRRAKETGPPVEPSTLDRIQTVFTYGLLVSLVAIVITVVVMYPSAMGLLEASGIYPARTVQNTANAENCRKRGRELGLSCEDIVLHHPSGVAFLACDNLEARQKYWPPIERWDTKFAGTGKIFMMDLKTSAEKLVALDLANFKGKLTTGGLGIWWDEADRDLVILNLVNHAPGGSTIEIFEHRLGSNMAIHLETVDASKGALNAPNNVQPVGRGSFYATNDHKFHKGVMRIVEEMFLTRWSHVVFRDEHTKQVRVVADGIAIANGIAISAEQSRIYVSSSLGHKIHVYERRPNNGLRLIEAVNLKFLAENLFVDPTTGAVLVTGHPRGLDLLNHMVNHKLKSATWIVKVTNNTDSDQFFGKNYKDDLVFSELGKHISGGTATVVDHTTGKTAIVGPFSEGVLVCALVADFHKKAWDHALEFTFSLSSTVTDQTMLFPVGRPAEQVVMGGLFTAMGLATMLFPNSIILLTFQQPFYTPPAVAAVAPIVDKSPQTKAVVKVDPPGPLRVAMQCFGSQATLCGLLILSCRFTKESYRNFGLAMVPYLEKKILGSYTIGKTIGQGAFSKVKLGIHKETGQKVAIKVIDKKQMALKAAKAKKANEDREKRKREQQGQQGQQGQPHQQPPKPEAPAPALKPTESGGADGAKTEGGVAPATADAGTPTFVSTMQLEVQLLMRLDHPNVINLYQVMETEDECYVVMEFASGGELIEYIAARNYLSEKEARRFFRQLISAMDHCHLANVVHRDLKLENLLLNDSKNLLISDFGLGRTFQNDTDELMKTFCGTPNYAAVELISGIPYIGVKSDIWAMGVVLFVMMTGKPPFTGENISALYSKIKAVDYTCPEYFSTDLRNLLAKILKKDPKERIDMDGLRADPWVNFEESGPPERLLPKVMGPPIPSQVGQCIASITRDSDFIVYTIRNHTRDGKNFAVHASAFPGAGKGPSGRRASSAGVMPGAGGRRRSSSLVPNAADLRTMQAPSRGRSPSPMDALQRPVIREDGEDEVSELPTTMPRSASPAGGRPPRRMTLNDINRPSPLALEAPLASDGPHSAPVQSSTPVPDPHPSTASLGRAPPARKRRNTINLLLGGLAPQNHSSVGSGSGHFRASTDEPRMIQTGSSDSTSSTAINRLSTTSAGPTFARPVSPSNDTASASGAVSASRRPRRSSVASSIHNGPIPTIVAPTPSFATPAHDRGLTVMRRMSMVQAPASSANSSESLPDPASGPRSAPPLGAGEYPPAFTGDASNQGGVVPSKEEIEGWHLMHRPAREIRAVRYNFNSATTSPLNPAAIFQEVHRVMMLLSRQFDGRLRFERVEDLYMLHCALKEGNEENNVEFEVEVCKIWLLKLHGIRIKRLTGSAFVFKDIYSSVVDALNL